MAPSSSRDREFTTSGTPVQRTVVTSVQIGEPRSELFSFPPGFEAVGQSVSPKALEDVARRDREKRANIVASYGLIGQLKLGWLRLISAFAAWLPGGIGPV